MLDKTAAKTENKEDKTYFHVHCSKTTLLVLLADGVPIGCYFHAWTSYYQETHCK